MNHHSFVSQSAKSFQAKRRLFWVSSWVTATLTVLLATTVRSDSPIVPNNVPFPNPSGFAATFSTNGSIDLTNEFFQNLGTNGRR